MSSIKEECEDISVMEVPGLKTEDQELKKEEYEEITVMEVSGLKTEEQEMDKAARVAAPAPTQPNPEQCGRPGEEETNDNGATAATKLADYVQRCAVPGCEGDVGTFHTLPKEARCQRAWLMFIYNRIPDNFNSKLLVCSEHFTPDNFSNLGQYRAGFAQRLTLKRGAVPALLASQPQPQPSTSYQLPLTSDVGCQTDAPSLASQGTQLSWKTLRPHLRSKGVQATVPCQSAAVGTASQRVTSNPLKVSRRAKRPRLELEEEVEVEDVSTAPTDPPDLTYEPAESSRTVTESSQPAGTSRSPYGESKFIVFEHCLLSLFQTCPACSRACKVRPHRRGTFLAVDQLCPHCMFFRQWRSQPVVGSTPAGDLQLSAAVYFSGASFQKMQKVFRAMQLKTHTYEAFKKHTRTYIQPAVVQKWNTEQKETLHRLSQEQGVIVGGDMRADATGHSAKYGSYSMMHLQSNTIIDIQLVQSNEVGGSHHMEKEGLSRSLDLLEEHGVKLDCVVTDSHPQIQQLLEDRKINHRYDIGLAEKDSKALNKPPINQRALSGVEKLSPLYQTSTVQSFHNIVSRFVPKNVVLPFIGMLCRLYLAAMHFNENADCPQTTASKGEPAYKPVSPKAKKRGRSVKPGKTEPTLCYVVSLMALVFDLVAQNPLPYVDAVQQISVHDGPPSEQAIAGHVSGFGRGGGDMYTSSKETSAPAHDPT